jgi:hypothetical protein
MSTCRQQCLLTPAFLLAAASHFLGCTGHSTFPVIQQSMAQSGLGQKAVTFGYAATAAICTLIGGFGYALWGPATEQVRQVGHDRCT